MLSYWLHPILWQYDSGDSKNSMTLVILKILPMRLMAPTTSPTCNTKRSSLKQDNSYWQTHVASSSARSVARRSRRANRASLQMHALSLRGDAKTIKGRVEHLALAHYMVGPNLPPIGQRSQKKRKFYWFTDYLSTMGWLMRMFLLLRMFNVELLCT